MRSHREIAEEILGYPIDAEGYAPCPGQHLHTTPSGQRDFRIFFDPAGVAKPHEHCFHASCCEARANFMSRLYSAINAEEKGQSTYRRPSTYTSATPPAKKITPTLDVDLAKKIAANIQETVDENYLLERSPCDIATDRTTWGDQLIDTLYPEGARILIFNRFASQGQYIRVARKANYKLSPHPGQKAQKINFVPLQAEDGMWFLSSPITGNWLPKPGTEQNDDPPLSRRSANCCTSFPYAVLESDVLPPEIWLKILVQLRDPIAAVYTSGGKSIHALIALGEDCLTPNSFNIKREELRRRLTPIGADPAAITAVRLTRYPGALRLSKRDAQGNAGLQKLLYLNPYPEKGTSIAEMPKRYC